MTTGLKKSFLQGKIILSMLLSISMLPICPLFQKHML